MNVIAIALVTSAALISPNPPGESKDSPRVIAGPMFTIKRSGIAMWVQANCSGAMEAIVDPLHDAHVSFVMCGIPYMNHIELEAVHRNIAVHAIDPYPARVMRIRCRLTNAAGSDFDRFNCDLVTPAQAGSPVQFTLAFGSCAHQERFAERQPIWEAVAKEKPDCFLFIGDNIYLPSDPAKYPKTRDDVLKLYRETYDRNRRMPELQPLLRSCYTFAIWDDHDFGPNNSDRTWKWADVALQALNEYFPNDYGLPDARGCFHRFSWGDVDVFMLDDRTFRDPNKAPDRRTMFGDRQLAWLKEGLAASKATFKVIVNGNQMLSDTHPHESWGTFFRPERDAFTRWLWDSGIRGVIFLAGDRHFAELVCKKDPQGKGEDLWELTSSPLANRHYVAGDLIPSRDRVRSYCGGVNFGLLDFDTAATPPRAVLKIKNVKGETVFKHTVERKN